MIIVVSDTHNNTESVRKVISQQPHAEALIHCGDVTDFSLMHMFRQVTENIYLVKGNGDIYNETAKRAVRECNILFSHQPFEFSIEGYGNFVIMHEPYFIEEYQNKTYIDFIIHGHTHRPYIKKDNTKTIFNPGALSSFLNPHPSYALIHNHRVALHRI